MGWTTRNFACDDVAGLLNIVHLKQGVGMHEYKVDPWCMHNERITIRACILYMSIHQFNLDVVCLSTSKP